MSLSCAKRELSTYMAPIIKASKPFFTVRIGAKAGECIVDNAYLNPFSVVYQTLHTQLEGLINRFITPLINQGFNVLIQKWKNTIEPASPEAAQEASSQEDSSPVATSDQLATPCYPLYDSRIAKSHLRYLQCAILIVCISASAGIIGSGYQAFSSLYQLYMISRFQLIPLLRSPLLLKTLFFTWSTLWISHNFGAFILKLVVGQEIRDSKCASILKDTVLEPGAQAGHLCQVDSSCKQTIIHYLLRPLIFAVSTSIVTASSFCAVYYGRQAIHHIQIYRKLVFYQPLFYQHLAITAVSPCIALWTALFSHFWIYGYSDSFSKRQRNALKNCITDPSD